MIAGVAWPPAPGVSIERWHEYCLLAGTAAVTLVGLLFVALSFHLDTLQRDEKAHLLGAARPAFASAVASLASSRRLELPVFGLVAALMLVNAAGISRDLLVQVGKLRAQEQERPRA